MTCDDSLKANIISTVVDSTVVDCLGTEPHILRQGGVVLPLS